jgi:ATP-binding cassette subfamily F protein 3
MQFINRFRAQATKARAVQSRIKALEKMESVELYKRRRVMSFRFPENARAGHEVVKLDGIRKVFGDRVVLPHIDATVYRGERVGIIGPNGAGKTTLLKVIAGELASDGGTLTLGYQVKPGYYAQHHAELLHPRNTVYDEVASINREIGQTRVRTILGAFLFSGDDVEKPIGVLSGGERARVALARLLMDPGNFLLLDEPTNHLDLESCESLIDTLDTFDGTMIFVSHNRAVVRRLATKIWSMEKGELTEYQGNLDDYMHLWRARYAGEEPREATPEKKPSANEKKKLGREDDKKRRREEAARRTERTRRLGGLEKKVAELEARIAELEKKQKERNDRLCDPAAFANEAERFQVLTAMQVDAEKIEELTMRWESAQEELDHARKELEREGAA